MNVKDKVFVITGATSGIGYEAANEIASQGGYVIFNSRDLERGRSIRNTLAAETNNEHIFVYKGNLASLKEVKTFADSVKEKVDRVDVLLNNAGVFMPKRKTSVDGFEMSFAVNHLAHFFLTYLLMELMVEAPSARIVNTSSEAHRGHKLDFGDIHLENTYSALKAYGRSKLANILFTRRLAEICKHRAITTYAFHPGVVNTGIIREGNFIFKLFFQLFGLTALKGAKPLLHLATSKSIIDFNGMYFNKMERQAPSAEALDNNVAIRLWELSEELCGINEPWL